MSPSLPSMWWDELALHELDQQQWEALCDGCGQCCLVKEWSGGSVKSCAVACRMMDLGTARCTDYDSRQKKVHECIKLVPSNVLTTGLLPKTCAYRLRAEGKKLPDWHYLNSGDAELVHELEIGIKHRIKHTEATVGFRDYMRYVEAKPAWE